MKRLCLFSILFAIFGAAPTVAQENPQQPATLDSTAQDSSVQTSAEMPPPDSAKTQQTDQKQQTPQKSKLSDHLGWIAVLAAAILTPFFAFLFNRLPKPLFDKSQRHYRKFLQKELGKIKLVGPGMDDIAVRLDDTFVHLRISGEYRSGEHPTLDSPARMARDSDGFAPDELIDEAFGQQKRDLLLIIGDPGSGKSTLMQYFAMRALSVHGGRKFGFGKSALPVFLPLREVKVEKSLAENLQQWCSKHHLSISTSKFDNWLQKKPTLILLDGLDEVREAKMRQEICRWIDGICSGLANARVVVTSRPTGYRGREPLVLKSDYLQADIRDFTQKQRQEFLQKWFTAAYLRETHLRPENESLREWRRGQHRQAMTKRDSLLKFLANSKNKSLRELSGIPMLLQIMAILWKKDDHLPNNRSKLYEVALDYLLEYRDAQRDLDPLLPTDQAQLVLAPACLWIQEEWQREEVQKEELHRQMHDRLLNMRGAPTAKAFCKNLVKRAGILADNTEDEYIFRHKSFREFFAGLELAKNYNKKDRLQKLAEGFFDEWWEEPLRFFISRSDGEAFDAFMAALFRTAKSADLDAKLMNRLITLVEDAREPQIAALAAALQNQSNAPGQHFAIIECLQKIGTEQALQAIEAALEQGIDSEQVSKRARQVLRERHAHLKMAEDLVRLIEAKYEGQIEKQSLKVFHNPLEYNAEYILIKGGTFTFQKGKELEAQKTVPDLYFAKYPVTNRQYRRFIRYLRGEESELLERVPLAQFGEKLMAYLYASKSRKDHIDFISNDAGEWAHKLVSSYDDDRKFNSDDQPVVGVSWYAAQTYCLWLSILSQTTATATASATATETAPVYRLPHETEWEWAAAGDREQQNGALRKYPWGETEPNDKLANYDGNVGATTPVGRYPDGANPECLQDMAGNVWEWQQDLYGKGSVFGPEARVLRGGAWNNQPDGIECAIRSNDRPGNRYYDIGFRCTRTG